MTSKIRRRTISAFIALSGLMSYLVSPCSAQEVLTGSVSATSGSPSSSDPAPAPPAATSFSGTNVIDFGNHDGGHFTLTGDLINNGTIYAISTNPAITTAIFSAPNIFNQTGATISSVLPLGGLPGYANAISGLSLIFNTTNNFVNAGTINSAGSLSINAGGSITNALPQGISAPPPVMQAITNIDIASQIGNIVNAGTIASMTGNINITAAANNALTMNNLGGIISALQGNINVRDALYTGTSQMNIAGGDWLSKNLNLMNGQGAITAQLRSATGIVNVYGLGANVGVWKGDLNLGVLKADGDPTYFSADGDVDLTAVSPINTDGEDLAIVAAGNITTAADLVINTNRLMTNGPSGNVLMVAGAKFINPVSGDGLPAGPLVSIQFTSPNQALDTGGSIAPGGALQINTSGALNNSSAGNVTLIAYQGTSLGSGEIRTGNQFNSFITATNAQGFSGGAVTMIAGGGGNGSDAINFGNITGGGGSSAINIYAATPTINGSGSVTVVNGTVDTLLSGSFVPNGLNAANISLVDLNNDGNAGLDSSTIPVASFAGNGDNGGAVTILTNGDLSVNSINSRGGKGGADVDSLSNAGAGGGGGTILLQGATVQALLVDVSGGEGGTGGSNSLPTEGGSGGDAGSLTANGSTLVFAANITAKGGAGGNGGTGDYLGISPTINFGGDGGNVVFSAPDIGVNDVDVSGGNGGTGIQSTDVFGGPAEGGGQGGSFTATSTGKFQAGNNIIAKGGAAGIAGIGTTQDGPVLGPGGMGGSIQITAGGDVDVNMLDVTGGDGGIVPFSNIGPGASTSNGGDGGSITINAGTGLFASDNFYANGGAGANGEDSIAALGSRGSNGGKGGTINLSGAACCLGDLSASGGRGGNGGAGQFGGNGGNGGAGGNINVSSQGITVGNVYAESGALGLGGIGQSTNGAPGTGGNGGSITLASPSTDPMDVMGIFGDVKATGVGIGNKGGTINISSGYGIEQFSGGVSSRGTDGADGGTINITAPALGFFGVDFSTGNAVDASSDLGNGGTINILTTDPSLPLSNGCGCNSIFGNIRADGWNTGGRINLAAAGGFNFESGLLITADAPNVSGGLIQFTQPGSSVLNFRSNAEISARNDANTLGRIGFNAGPTGGVDITGDFGTLTAGEFVGVGNLDPTTLAVINPLEVQLSDFPIFNYSMVQGTVTNKIFVSVPQPPRSTSTPSTTLTGGVSKEVVVNIPQPPSNSTITNIDQTPFIVSLADIKLMGGGANPSTFIDGVLVSTASEAIGAKGLTISQADNGLLVLGKGNMLLLPPAGAQGGMEVQTQEGTLTVAPGSMAFLMETGNDVAVYALHEDKRGDITFRSGKHSIDLSTGQQAVFSRNTTEFFSKLNPGALIPARQVNEYKLDNGVKAFIAEYSMPMALSIIRPLKGMRQSENADLRKVSGTVQKNAAILSLIGTRFGPYKGAGGQ